MIQAILVDDEPLAIQLLARKLQAFTDVEVVSTYSNPIHILDNLQDLSCNVAFLDIDMPGINGIDLAEKILNVHPTMHIVFVTAYRDYAVQAFELNSIDYIVKPLSDDRLEKTIMRIKRQLLSAPTPQVTIDNSLKIQCFSEFIVIFNQEAVKWKTAKVRELFAFLLTHHQTFINRDILIETLWPNTEYAKAKIQLHTALSHLRKALDNMGYPKVITFANQGYCLELTDVQCEAVNIMRLYNEQPLVTAENIESFKQAISQYEGDYLEAEGYEWSHIHATAIRQQMMQLLERMIIYFEQLEDHVSTLQYLEQLLQLDPYSEQILQRLLTHCIHIRYRTEAIKAFQDFKERLDEELGISPDSATSALYNQVLLTD